MRAPILFRCLLCTACLTACKKNTLDTPSNVQPVQLNQSLSYKTVATVPSPADFAKGLLRDSLEAPARKKSQYDADFYINLLNVSASTIPGYGFTLGYKDPNKSLPYFSFTAAAFPGVPREMQLNKAYEYTSTPGSPNQKPVFLGSHTGNDGMSYFVNNVFPADAQFPPASETHTSITFTKKLKFPLSLTDSVLYVSGRIAGYCLDRYGVSDPGKYVQRWDFTVDFTDLKVDK